jgi:hypothetical protein
MDNNRVIRIVKGLSEGEKILLAPPLAPSEAPLKERGPDEPEHQAESSELTLPKVPALKQKTLAPQEEETGAPEETPSDVSEIAKAQRKQLSPSQQPKPETTKSRLNSKHGQVYCLVQKGETLSKIAGREDVYGDPIKWPSLFRHNIDKLGQMEEVEDFEHQELPEGLELKFLTHGQVSENLKKLGQKLWVVNVMSEKTSKKISPPAITLMKSGYHTYITRVTVKGEKWIRIRVGFFEKRSEAVSEEKKIIEILNNEKAWAVKIGKGELEEFGGL